MDNTYAILHVLRYDLSWLGEIAASAAMVMFVPALVVGFFAAARADPTLWRDLPVGVFRCWLAGSLAAVILILVGLGFYGLVEQEITRDQRPILGWVTIGWSVCGFMACLVVQFRAATRYFRWRIQERLGWKIDEPAPPPANRWYSFSLRNLLLVQLAVVFAFGLWVSSRRAEIRARYERLQTEAWRADLRGRLEEHGWVLQYFDRPVSLRTYGPLTDFDDAVLDKILPSDHLRELELKSDSLTDAGLKKLSRHAELERLTIESAQVTDAGIAHLRELPRLSSLTVRCPQLTAEVLHELESMQSLRSVLIFDVQIAIDTREFRKKRPDVSIGVAAP